MYFFFFFFYYYIHFLSSPFDINFTYLFIFSRALFLTYQKKYTHNIKNLSFLIKKEIIAFF